MEKKSERNALLHTARYRQRMKKIVITVLAGLLVLGLVTSTAMATSRNSEGRRSCAGRVAMWDEEKNLIERSAFETSLDELVAEGVLDAERRERLLERHDRYADNGGTRPERGESSGRRGCGVEDCTRGRGARTRSETGAEAERTARMA